MKQIFARLDRCTGCKTCELYCRVEHSQSKTLFGALTETPLPRRRLFVETDGTSKVPVLCRHCEDAPCLNACLSGALWRDERGAVRRKKEKCIGCWTCIMVCPYGVIGRQLWEGRWLSVKCDLCDERKAPACVDSCPTKALIWAQPEEVSGLRRRGFAAEVGKVGRA